MPDLHKRVVDRDHEDLASIFELGMIEETGNVGIGARRA